VNRSENNPSNDTLGIELETLVSAQQSNTSILSSASLSSSISLKPHSSQPNNFSLEKVEVS
jgi:hypothetical protein